MLPAGQLGAVKQAISRSIDNGIPAGLLTMDLFMTSQSVYNCLVYGGHPMTNRNHTFSIPTGLLVYNGVLVDRLVGFELLTGRSGWPVNMDNCQAGCLFDNGLSH